MIVVYFILFLSIVLECFPISSSGNIELVIRFIEHFFKQVLSVTTLSSLDYLSHGAIALTVVVYFFSQWKIFFKRLPKTFLIAVRLCCAGFITEIITVFAWFLVSRLSLPSWSLFFGFIITTVALWSLRFIPKKIMVARFSLRNAWLFGIVQGCALLPGISRFASTFVLARCLGFRAQKSFELSFLLGLPINIGAFFLGLYTINKHNLTDLLNLQTVLVMLIGSSVAWFCFCGVGRLVASDRLWFFAYYTALTSVIALFMLC